ncbi:MAG: efflux transporter outer membrane subunit [Dyella sp.]
MKKPDRVAVILAASLLGACSMAPAYKPPAVPVAASYQPTGPWTTAAPADQLPREGWWKIYADPRLDQLEDQLLAHNTDLAVALASYQQSRDFLNEVRADLFPQLSVGGSATRNRQSSNVALRSSSSPTWYNAYSVTGQASYEVDLWGQVRDSVAASRAQMQASAADLASVRLSLETQLASSYVALVGLDRQIDLLQTSVTTYMRALQLTQTLHQGGAVSGLDVDQAQTLLSSTRSQLSQTQAQRALLQHAIAVLVGESASTFVLQTQTALPNLPVIPIGLPSTLLQRRPDIAAAERLTAAANAQIGVAKSAFFPSLDLSAQGGLASAGYGSLLTAPSRLWALGPSALLSVFDGGLRRAQLAAARAATDQAGASYRGVVLAAFQQVEDNQSQLTELGSALVDQQEAVAAADRTLNLSLSLYKQGADSYLNVVTAQVTALQAHQTLLSLQVSQLQASVNLVKALGGGWSSDELDPKRLAQDQRQAVSK